MASRQLVTVKEVTKAFGTNLALDRANFDIFPGEVQALLGENGAGKTTLMNVLSGLYRPDSGTILIEGNQVRIRSPKEALDLGINCVHQHFQLVDNFTVFENVVLGGIRAAGKTERISREDILRLGEERDLPVTLDAKVKGLQMGQRQRVEILKALIRKPKVLLLDEPTTNLVPQEVDDLLKTMRMLVKEGIGVVFITHKIKEAMSVSDRVTILRHGKNVGSHAVTEVTERNLVELMIGSAAESIAVPVQEGRAEEAAEERLPLLEVSNVTLQDKKEGVLLNGINLKLYPGEILGVAGVAGNGQKSLVETIACVRNPTKGSIKIAGTEVSRFNASAAMNMGLNYIPEDRMHDGILPGMSVAENLLLSHQEKDPYSKSAILQGKEIEKMAENSIATYRIKAEGSRINAATLSGGNIQKLLVARALLSSPKILVAHNPTRGLDVNTTNFVLNSLISLKAGGGGILFVCEDLDELMSVCDRITVLFKGEIQGTLGRKEFDKYKIGSMMLSQTATEKKG